MMRVFGILATIAISVIAGFVIGRVSAGWVAIKLVDEAATFAALDTVEIDGLALELIAKGDAAGAQRVLNERLDRALADISHAVERGYKPMGSNQKFIDRAERARKAGGYSLANESLRNDSAPTTARAN
jgi:hypothetical protein